MLLSNSNQKGEEVDIISKLPDSLLSYVLSFLPTTKQVVATSILSKRWIEVWTLVDKLVFDNFNDAVKLEKWFTPFVYRALELHQDNIKDLRLSCKSDECTEVDVTNWIHTAISRGVEKLDVITYFNYKCPLSIFTCDTLIDLKIRYIDVSNVKVITAPLFPRLKELNIDLSSDSESFQHIVSQCAALEHLVVHAHKTPFDIVSSSVKRLELHISRLCRRDEKILLAVPSLEYLVIYQFPLEFIVVEKLSSLVEADINFRGTYSQNVDSAQLSDSFIKFIQHLSNVKVLRLDCHFKKFLDYIGHGQFLNLTKLEIVSPFFEWRFLVSLMELSINLETITLKKTSTLKKHKLAWKDPNYVPTCLSLSLRKLSIDGYSEDELRMVQYVLRTAKFLERVDIRCAANYFNTYGYTEQKWKYDKLQYMRKLHRACEKCEISLV